MHTPRRRVRLVSAPFEHEWNLARAYNLAARVATGHTLLKVDSDTYLNPRFLRLHSLRLLPRAFYAGDWTKAPDENAWHLNGVLLLRRADFNAVAGYDERMRRYGWDDTDLYHRLITTLNLSRRCINYSAIEHRSDGHASRGQT